MNFTTRIRTIIFSVLLISGIFGFFIAQSLKENKQELAKATAAYHTVLEVFESKILADEYSFTHVLRAKAQWFLQKEKIEALIRDNEASFRTPEEKELVAAMQSSMAESKVLFEQVIQLHETASSSAGNQFVEEREIRLVSQLSVKARETIVAASALAAMNHEAAHAALVRLIFLFFVLAFGFLVMLLLSFWEISLSASRLTLLMEAKEEFLLKTAHDLRAPTNIIKLLLGQYQDKGLLLKYPETQKSFVLIQEVNTRMGEIIAYLFQYAKGENSDLALKKEVVNVGEILREVIRELSIAAEKRGVAVTYTTAPTPQVLGDADALREVFWNLIENAIKYNKEGGKIVLSSEAKRQFLEITITDSGIGIDAAYIPKLFTPYYRAYSGDDIKGTGLGLFIVKRFVEKMGGMITVSSVLEQETTFVVALPIAE